MGTHNQGGCAGCTTFSARVGSFTRPQFRTHWGEGGGLQSTIAVSIIECLGRTPLKLKQPDFGGLYRLILPHGLTNDFKPSALNPKPSGTKKRRVQGLGYCWILHMGGQNYGPFLGP